jgi:ABC-type Fe3+/spermidine/putrescine transport system ATPase subunit
MTLGIAAPASVDRTPAVGGSSAAGGMGHVAIRNVSKRFGAVAALTDVSLTIPAGAFYSLLGPSGCGKTTLLRILAGLERPDSGQVLVGDRDITATPPERRPFNIVFQRYALFPHLSVRDNVAFGLTTDRRSRPPRDEIVRRAELMLELVGLGGYGERYPSQLSGGQAQRVAVARALVRQPDMLLLDEPLSALDRNVRHALREELLRIHTDTGTTFLLVTHDQDEALSMSQHVALMNHGRIEQVADPETLYRQPATRFAARFIGAGTFLSARVVEPLGEEVLIEGISFRFRAHNSGVTGGAAEVLLRPEDLEVVAPDRGRVAGPVRTCAFFGSHYELTVEVGDQVFRARCPVPVAPGGVVGLSWPEPAGIAYPAS